MMRIHLRQMLAVFLVLFVAACSGGGGGGATNQLGSEGGGGLTDPGLLPVSGAARYDGFLTLALPTQTGRQPFTGVLGLDVNFDAPAAQVTGQASQFRSASDEVLDGRIIITDGDLDRSADLAADYTFESQLSGTLSGTDFRNIVITGTMLGDFSGDTASAVSGQTFGDVVTPLGFDIFNGTFSASAP